MLCFVFHAGTDWQPYVIVSGGGWLVTALVQRCCYRSRTQSTEFLGTYISGIFYEEPWTEIYVTEETYTDEDGETRTRKRIDYIHHSEEFYFCTDIGTTHYINEDSFLMIKNRWHTRRYPDVWYGSEIAGGARFGCHYLYEDVEGSDDERVRNLFTITEPHKYTNKIKHSNSIFRFEKIDRNEAESLGLIDYPEITDFDLQAILSNEFNVPHSTERAYRVFNSVTAPRGEMHLFVLLFNAQKTDIGIVEKQRAYWCGGNKNEFSVCLGLDNGEVKWARAFSWADEPILEAKTADWFRRNPQAELVDYLEWLYRNYKLWERKSFSDFDYIRVSLTTPQLLMVYAAAILASATAMYFILT